MTARSKNGDETSVKPTQKQQLSNSKVITKPSSSSQAPDTLTKSNNTPEGKRNTSILDFFSKVSYPSSCYLKPLAVVDVNDFYFYISD